MRTHAQPTGHKSCAGTPGCEAPHLQYHVSGQLAIRMDGGTEFMAGRSASNYARSS